MTAEGWFALGEGALCWLAIRRQRRLGGAEFPLIPGLLLAHLMLFGLPAALFRDQFLGLGSSPGILGSIWVTETLWPEALRGAALMVFVGMLALVAGYELPLAAMLLAPMPSIRITWRRNPVPPALLLMGCGLAAAVIEKGPHPLNLEGILGAVSFVGLWAMGALWLLNWRGLLGIQVRAATWVMTAALMGLEIVQSALWRPLIDAVLLLAIYRRARGRTPWFAIALALPVFLSMAAAKVGFRMLLSEERLKTTGALEKLEIYRQSLELAYDNPAGLDLEEIVLTRMSEIQLLGVVVQRSPRFIPYWRGATYVNAAWSLVPRFLLPTKPTENSGQDFPHRYDIIEPGNDHTSVNLATLIEMYANFGPAGVIVGMMLFGVACRGLELLFVDAIVNDATYTLAAPVLASLLLIEQPFYGAFGAFVQHTPILILVLELCGICGFSLVPVATAAATVSAERGMAHHGARG